MSATHLTDEAFQALLHLSKLQADEETKKKLKSQAENIIGYFDKLSTYDTKQVKSDYSSALDSSLLRTDEVKPSLVQRDLKSFANGFLDGYFSVPKIFEGGE